MVSDLMHQTHIPIQELDNQCSKQIDELNKQHKLKENRKSLKFNELTNSFIKFSLTENDENNNTNDKSTKVIEHLDTTLEKITESSNEEPLNENNNSNDDNLTIHEEITEISLIPKKSCLSQRSSEPNLKTVDSLTDLRKRVKFADLHGKELFSIKTITEPSDCPPKLNSKYVKFFLNREYANEQSSSSKQTNNSLNNQVYKNLSIIIYTLNFEQPAADYLRFHEKIQNNNVSLENVIINRFNVTGTIKVKNICFNKSVFVRCTFDCWKTYNDFHATYLPNFYSNNDSQHRTSVIDTFKFEFSLPNTIDTNAIKIAFDKFNFRAPNHESLENSLSNVQFCVCFKSIDDNCEYWDNNSNINYKILQYLVTLNNKVDTIGSNICNANKEIDLEDKLSNINTNYLQLLIQEQNLNTIIDHFFYNSLPKSNNDNSETSNRTSKLRSSCSNDSLSWRLNDTGHFSVPYW